MKTSTHHSALNSFDTQRRALRITHLAVFVFLVAIVLQYRQVLGVVGVIGVPIFVGLIMALQYIHKMTKIRQAEEKQQGKREGMQANKQIQNIGTKAPNSDL
jgi:hypothetical protein